jgi:membrane-associated phospholipid phosphatase
MIYFYVSLALLLLLNVFMLKDPKVIRAFSICLIVTVLIAGLIFILFPGRLGFTRVSYVPGYEWIFSLLHAVDQPFNLYPSLHITYSSLTVFAIIDQTKSRIFHVFLLFWLVLIAFSVVLVHQHHLFDIITGLILAGIVIKFVYRKLVPKKALFKS